jgi:predicted transcriptional regulator
MSNLTKTTVYLEAEAYRRLKALAERQGRSAAELVREAVEQYTTRREVRRLPSSVGSGSSGGRFGALSERAEELLDDMGES